MIFKNPSRNQAIILSNNFISFHKLTPYESWELSIEPLAKNGLEIYKSIGLGEGIVNVQALYLNKYTLNFGEKISDYLSFIPSVEDFGIGVEKNLIFQSHYSFSPNLEILLKLNKRISNENQRELFLECSCFAGNENNFTADELVKQAHDQANLVFDKITK